jgi:hypothetical protein
LPEAIGLLTTYNTNPKAVIQSSGSPLFRFIYGTKGFSSPPGDERHKSGTRAANEKQKIYRRNLLPNNKVEVD